MIRIGFGHGQSVLPIGDLKPWRDAHQGVGWFSGQIICKDISASFDIFGLKIPLRKPVGLFEELWIWQQFFLELQHLRKRAHVHFNGEVMVYSMELEFFNSSFYGKNLFESGMVILFSL